MESTAGTEHLSERPSSGATVAHLLRWRATHQAGRVGYRFLEDGESRETLLTYAELDARARAVAALLSQRLKPGSRVLVAYPPGLEFISAWFGCLYAGAIPVVAPPPHPVRLAPFLSRVTALIEDARPAVALSTADITEHLPPTDNRPAPVSALPWLATDGALPPPVRDFEPPVREDDLAFLQYTSGATTTPRGVMVTHRNLMANLNAIQGAFWHSSDRGSVSWLPPHHDMGLIGGILGPLYVGSPATLLSPLAFLQRPRRWLQAITRFQAAVSGGPNFAYAMCAQRLTPEQCADLDLSSWRVAFNGAEPIHAATLRDFVERFAPHGFGAHAFKPCYGLAESTLLVSVSRSPAPPRILTVSGGELERHRITCCSNDAADARDLVSCGPPVSPTIIVDPESLHPCAAGRVGEIWVSGASIARGYWNQPDQTRQAFQASPNGDGDRSGPYLRTGDLGFLLDGELFVTGRIKDLIIIDGANHYPQDIEWTVGHAHPALDPAACAAFAVDRPEGEGLIVVAAVQSHGRPEATEVHRAIRTAVSEQHDLRIHDLVLVQKGGIPRTSSGKVRRHACRADYLAHALVPWEGDAS